MTSDIELDVDGATMPAHLALPEGTARGGVVVLQEIYGITDSMRATAALLAGEGYAAIVPELFHRTERGWVGVPGTDAARGMAAAKEMTLDNFGSDLAAAESALRTHLPAGATLAVWGFCLGGSLAFYAATLPSIDAAVSFYGGQIAKSSALEGSSLLERYAAAIRAPILFAFGEEDQSIPAEDREKNRAAMEAAGKTFEFYVYPGVGHAFFRDGLASSDAAGDAWERVRAFLAKNVAV